MIRPARLLMFALVDCNACYASCEQIFRPDLRGKPIVVLSNNDGCIVTRNKEAKALQIPDLEPYFKIKSILEQNHVHVFSSNYELYGDTSSRIMALLETFGAAIEVYSIDEAFLDLSGFSDAIEHGHKIKQACWKQQRMPVCVGIAKTKTLAKLANHIAKKSNRLNGVCFLDDLEAWEAVFKKLPVSKVWGVGSRITRRLSFLDVHTVQDLRRQSLKQIRKEFGVTLERTVAELNGERCFDLETQPEPKKEIFCSRSFSHKITTERELIESVANYATRAAEKLRRQNGLTQRIYVMAQTSRFKTPYYGNSLSTGLLYPTNDSRHIAKVATDLCRKIYKPGFGFARAGVGLLDLTHETNHQGDLFTPGQSDSSKSMMKVMDSINRRYGKGNVFLASQGIKQHWAMSRQMKSPGYTTRLSDLPLIRV